MKPIYLALFCGDRDWTERAPILSRIRTLKRTCARDGYELVIVEGEAPGADLISRVTAEEENVHVARVAALWNTRHQSAGPQRNRIMLALEPDEVCAYHRNIKKSRGTKDCITQALKLDIPVNLNNKPYKG